MLPSECIHPLPISNPQERAYIEYYKQLDKQQALDDLYLPAVFNINEIIHSDDTPPQVRLQASQVIINKVIGDKIEITQQKQIVDINKLIDQAMAIRSITQDNISKSDKDAIIDVTPSSET